MGLSKILKDVPKGKRKKAAQHFGEIVREKILEYTGNERSPISKQGRYKALSKKYKEFKRDKGKGTRPNLRLNEDMLPSMRVDATKKDFTLRITDRVEKLKAYNHNVGDTVPKRQFIPRGKQKLKRNILKEARESMLDLFGKPKKSD